MINFSRFSFGFESLTKGENYFFSHVAVQQSIQKGGKDETP
jgi:hypothetical protein